MGGSVQMGTKEAPFLGRKAFIELHGDVRVDFPYEFKSKSIAVNGELTVYGEPRQIVRRIGADAAKGSKTITIGADQPPVDWRPGERLCLFGIGAPTAPTQNKQFASALWPMTGEFRAGQTKVSAFKEYAWVKRVSADGRTVTLKHKLKNFFFGGQVDQDGVRMDVRDTVVLMHRNVEIRGGDDPRHDRITGLTVRQQEYGFTIFGEGETYEPKVGWTPDMPNYEEDGKLYVPPGNINIHFADFINPAKQEVCDDACATSYTAVLWTHHP